MQSGRDLSTQVDRVAVKAVPTILVVEDEVWIRALVSEVLRDEGFQVVEAASGDEALTFLIVANQVDLVFTDIDMPGSIDGIALAKYIRDHHTGVKVILTSGGMRGKLAVSLGGFIPKPFDMADIVAMVRSAIAQPDEPGA